jgi:hypothetical protein
VEPADVFPAVREDRVPVRWTGPGGADATGVALIGMSLPAGARITVWVDRSGQIARPPSSPTTALAAGWLRGTFIALGGWVLLAAAWFGIGRATAARDAGGWAREWERVEPLWSGCVG